MKLRPLGDKVLVKRNEAETQTKSGIFLPETAKEKPQQATVLAVGDGKLLENGKRAQFQVKKGDTIIIGKWGGTELKVDEQEASPRVEQDIADGVVVVVAGEIGEDERAVVLDPHEAWSATTVRHICASGHGLARIAIGRRDEQGIGLLD